MIDPSFLLAFEQTKAELEDIEVQLTELFEIGGDVRTELFALVRRNDVIGDHLIARWANLYSEYLNGLRVLAFEASLKE